jgi:PAS domain S-box-containing protein
LPDAEFRLHQLFTRYIRSFARKECPLVFFMDNLHWADAASLKLLRFVAGSPELNSVMMIATYRADDPRTEVLLTPLINEIKKRGLIVNEMTLDPLNRNQLLNLLAESLRTEASAMVPLGDLIHLKTGGNPFSVIQCLEALQHNGSLAFDDTRQQWQMNLDKAHSCDISDNVIDHLVKKLKSQSELAQRVLSTAAAIGHVLNKETLALLLGIGEHDIEQVFTKETQEGLLIYESGEFCFAHDRIQEAALSLLDSAERDHLHFKIARNLHQRHRSGEKSNHLFDILNYYDRALHLLDDPAEKEQVVELALLAGRKAKDTAAFHAAAKYFALGMELLPQEAFTTHHELAFELTLERARCEFRSFNPETAQQLLDKLYQQELSRLERLGTNRLSILCAIAKGDFRHAIAIGDASLALFDKECQIPVTFEKVVQEYDTTLAFFKGRDIFDFVEQPLSDNPEIKAIVSLLSDLAPACFACDRYLFALNSCYAIQFGMLHGHTEASTEAYARFGLALQSLFHRYEEGYRFGQLGLKLAERHGLTHFEGATQGIAEILSFWTHPLSTMWDHLMACGEAAERCSDLLISCFYQQHVVTDMLLRGDHLDDVAAQTERALEFINRAHFDDLAIGLISAIRFIQSMQGASSSFSGFSDEEFNEAKFEAQLQGIQLLTVRCWHYVFKLKARFIFGDYEKADEAAREAATLLHASMGFPQVFEYTYYHALTLAALHDRRAPDRRQPLIDQLEEYEATLRHWAEQNPSTFLDKHLLVAAELARIKGSNDKATALYEKAIHAARDNNFIQHEAICYEVAAHSYQNRGFDDFPLIYFKRAQDAYDRWGAYGKVHQLAQHHSSVTQVELSGAPFHATYRGNMSQFDLDSMLASSQALSGEIELEKLIHTLIRLVMSQAGADTCTLALMRAGHLRVFATGEMDKEGMEASLRKDQNNLDAAFENGSAATPQVAQAASASGSRTQANASERIRITVSSPPLSVESSALPLSLVRYVQRRGETVLLKDTAGPHPFSDDIAQLRPQPKSLLCMPLKRQGRIMGMLYLQNNVTTGVFTSNRLNMLEVLAVQAAISIDNAQLYRDLQEQAGIFKATITSMADGVLAVDNQGRIIFMNQALELQLNILNRPDLTLDDIRDGRPLLNWKGRDLEPDDLSIYHALAGKPIAHSEILARHPHTDKEMFLQFSAAPMKNDQGDIIGAVAVVRDLTELVELDQLKDQFLRIATHELKTPIMIIKGYSQLLSHESATLPGMSEPLVKTIEQAADRLTSLVNASFDASQLQLGLLQIKTQPLDLASLVKQAAHEFAAVSSKHHICMTKEIPAPILGDAMRLKQVITNLLSNATKFSPEGSAVEVAVDRFGEKYALVSVRDYGLGIPASKRERIFERFYQAHIDTAHDVGGLGLGLYIVKEIISLHAGRIWLDSEENRGSTFFFTLPLQHDLSRDSRTS